MTEQVLVERRDNVLLITMNRPDARNAMTLAMSERIAAAVDELDSDDTLSAAVLTGGASAFCAGMDLKGFLRGEKPSVPGRGFGGITQRPPVKPLIASVEGWALAGGFELVLACDLVVAAETARFGLPETKRGLVAAAGGLFRLRERVPANVALELILTGDPIDASRLHRFGLVNRLTETGAALREALELAQAIAANGPLAVAASKRVFAEAPDWARDERFERQAPITGPISATNDAREGAAAFAEKRRPEWTRS
ncbi:crotonase/enoyl-CoA hydratase family protein [Nocardia callitridis]|uniref:Crotonase/enoyl-CoA hydratase family protein n=1 Tax=Nocardia callitridis TaxID=648753 RepID=A0ABP9KPI4_9NOCA